MSQTLFKKIPNAFPECCELLAGLWAEMGSLLGLIIRDLKRRGKNDCAFSNEKQSSPFAATTKLSSTNVHGSKYVSKRRERFKPLTYNSCYNSI